MNIFWDSLLAVPFFILFFEKCVISVDFVMTDSVLF